MAERFDVLERFERLLEAPEPSFEGFLRLRDRKRRNQRIVAGVVAQWPPTGAASEMPSSPKW